MERTIDYAAVAAIVEREVLGQTRQLIESVAEHIAARLLEQFALLQAVTVTVHKPAAPIRMIVADVSVTIRRTRASIA